MRHARHARYGNRINGLIVVLWRAGLRINEALSLNETDLEERRGSILVRHGKNDRRRQVGMDAWGWSALGPWLSERATLPVGPLFCVIAGPTRGHAWSAGAARLQLHQIALEAGVRRRFAPHQLRHAHAVELLHEGIALPLIQRQLGHSHLSTTGTYLQGISAEEIISTVHARCQWPSVSPHWWSLNSPLVAIVSPHWWPSDLPIRGHRFSPAGSWVGVGSGSGEGLHPLAGGRLGEPVALLAVGDDHVRVMQQPVDGRGRHGLRHQFVEP